MIMKAPTTDKHVLSFFIDRSVSAAGSVVVFIFLFVFSRLGPGGTVVTPKGSAPSDSGVNITHLFKKNKTIRIRIINNKMFMSCVFQLPLPFFLIASFMARKTGQVLNSPLVALDTASYQYFLEGILRV